MADPDIRVETVETPEAPEPRVPFDMLAPERGWFRALRHPQYRFFWAGNFVSNVGTWMQNVAQGWLVLELTNSPFLLGVVGFAQQIPALIFSLPAGVLADRAGRRFMLLLTQSMMMLFALCIWGLTATNLVTVEWIVVLAFLAGTAMAFNAPNYQAAIRDLVEEQDTLNAIALNSIQFNLARVIGPIIAGVTLASLGMVACFGVNGISFLFVIAAILALRDIHVPAAATVSIVDQMKDGLRYVRQSHNLKAVTLLGFIGAFLGLPLLTFLPVITRDVFQQDVGFYSRLMTFSGAGAVTGALIVAYIGKHRHIGRLLLIFLASFGTVMALFALSRTPALSATLLFIAGALLVMSFSLTTSLAQLLAPGELRGRVVSIYMVAFRGGSPLGGLASGWLVTQVGSAPAVLLMNGLLLTSIAIFFLIRGHGLKDV